jgi:ribose/xylose/arabinose/galactoside ABC-type transport system permease subunit
MYRAIFNSAFVMGTLAIGLSCLLISGKIDLSAGNTGMMAGIVDVAPSQVPRSHGYRRFT